MEAIFKDKHGNAVHPGDSIKILKHFNYGYYEGKVCQVDWDERVGAFCFKFTDVRHGREFPTTDYFFGVHEFELYDHEVKERL